MSAKHNEWHYNPAKLPDPLSQLEAAARVATPGPWHWDWDDGTLPTLCSEWGEDRDPTVLGCYVCDACKEIKGRCLAPNEDNAAFIALANPATILALIGRLRKAEAVVFQVRIYASFDPAEGSSARHIAHRKTVEALAEYDKGSK